MASKIKYLFVSAFAKPSDFKNSDIYDEIQNDGDDDEYGDLDPPETPGSNVNVETVPSSNELPKIHTVGQTIVEDLHKSVQLPCNATGGESSYYYSLALFFS